MVSNVLTHGRLSQGPPPEKKRSKFCSQCGGPIEWGVPTGDHCWRHVCSACGFIDYFNPRMVRVSMCGHVLCSGPWRRQSEAVLKGPVGVMPLAAVLLPTSAQQLL